MSYKQVTTLSQAYDSTAPENCLNSILQALVTLIRQNNSDIKIIDHIIYGSEQMTGAPLYTAGSTGCHSSFIPSFESDVYILGESEDSICITLAFSQGRLVISMGTSISVANSMDEAWMEMAGVTKPHLSPLMLYAGISSSSSSSTTTSSSTTGWRTLWYTIPYVVASDKVEIKVTYTTGDYSQCYRFQNSAGYDDGTYPLVFVKQSNSHWACIISQKSTSYWYAGNTNATTLCFGFDEVIDIEKSGLREASDADALATGILYNPHGWCFASSSSSSSSSSSKGYGMYFSITSSAGYNKPGSTIRHAHAIMNRGSNNSDWNNSAFVSTVGNYTSLANCPIADSAWNLPILSSGKAWIRKVIRPCSTYTTEAYYLFKACETAMQAGEVYKVGSGYYMVIEPGLPALAARVA